jgi:predicted methyltransferase
VKQLSLALFLPVPIISAIKNELKKQGVVETNSGVSLTSRGEETVRSELKIEHVNLQRYLEIIKVKDAQELLVIFPELFEIFEERPEVDVTIDQSKATVETSLKRALYLLQNNELLAGELLCLGDDDLVSVACAFLHQYIFDKQKSALQIVVFDKDERILNYIKEVTEKYSLSIQCESHDLLEALPKEVEDKFDCVITDTPYTYQGLNLFIMRSLYCLKDDKLTSIFLSYGRKAPKERLEVQEFLTSNGIIIEAINEQFNVYEGAQIIGGVSDLYLLKVVNKEKIKNEKWTDKIYTRELNQRLRTYQCLVCQRKYQVGDKQKFLTIEQLKENKCLTCSETKFKLVK